METLLLFVSTKVYPKIPSKRTYCAISMVKVQQERVQKIVKIPYNIMKVVKPLPSHHSALYKICQISIFE